MSKINLIFAISMLTTVAIIGGVWAIMSIQPAAITKTFSCTTDQVLKYSSDEKKFVCMKQEPYTSIFALISSEKLDHKLMTEIKEVLKPATDDERMQLASVIVEISFKEKRDLTIVEKYTLGVIMDMHLELKNDR